MPDTRSRLCVLALLAFALIAPTGDPAPMVDVLLGGERIRVPLASLSERVPLADGEEFRVAEIGRDAHASHHVVAIRTAETPHRHDRHALFVVMVRGHGTWRVGDDTLPVGEGSLLSIPRGTVHAWQCDHMGHVNVRAYAEFFEEACWQFYSHVGITPSLLRAGEVNMAAVRQDTRYLKELLAGDVIAVRTTMLEARDKVLRFLHELVNCATGELCASSEFTVVCIDARARKSRPFPPEVLAKARQLVAPA